MSNIEDVNIRSSHSLQVRILVKVKETIKLNTTMTMQEEGTVNDVNGLFLLEMKAKVTGYQLASPRIHEDFLSSSVSLHLKITYSFKKQLNE